MRRENFHSAQDQASPTRANSRHAFAGPPPMFSLPGQAQTSGGRLSRGGTALFGNDARLTGTSGFRSLAGSNIFETQSQTIRGENLNNPHDDGIMENIEDSDQESHRGVPGGPGTLSPPQTDRCRSARTERRVTFNALVDDGEGSELIMRTEATQPPQEYRFRTLEDLQQLLSGDNGATAFRLLKDGLHEWEPLHHDLELANSAKTRLEEQLARQAQAHQDRLADVAKEKETAVEQVKARDQEVARIRLRRDEHRKNSELRFEQVQSLRFDKENLQKQLDGFLRKTRTDPLAMDRDSDEDHQPRQPLGQDYRNPYQPRVLQRPDANQFGPPMGRFPQQELPAAPKHKYPELPLFYGEAEEWEHWKAHLITKVQTDYGDFPSEWHKINYARDRTKSTARDTIWYRAKPDSKEPFVYLEELIEALEEVYGEQDEDRERKLLQELFKPSFAMGATDKNETLERFIARYNSTISTLGMKDTQKIVHLKRNLSKSYLDRAWHLSGVNKYKTYVDGLRAVGHDTKLHEEDKNTSKSTSVRPRGYRASASETARKEGGYKRPAGVAGDRGPRRAQTMSVEAFRKLPSHVQTRLRKEGRCFKCGEKGHIASDPKAPCVDAPHITREKAEAVLSEMGIEYKEEDFDNWMDEELMSDLDEGQDDYWASENAQSLG